MLGKIKIWTLPTVLVFLAVYRSDLTLGAVAFVMGICLQAYHVLEVKINLLLDDRGLRVTEKDLFG